MCTSVRTEESLRTHATYITSYVRSTGNVLVVVMPLITSITAMTCAQTFAACVPYISPTTYPAQHVMPSGSVSPWPCRGFAVAGCTATTNCDLGLGFANSELCGVATCCACQQGMPALYSGSSSAGGSSNGSGAGGGRADGGGCSSKSSSDDGSSSSSHGRWQAGKFV
jgi:uncharacterized membrane protein YgcG